MRSALLLAPVLLAPLLAACATAPQPREGSYKVGNPYQIAGRWYHPKDDPHYEETGMASWYGPGFHGKATANGERFNENDLTAAHRTLPMPSYVEVTNLENGRKLRLRVNDRGPFAKDRIIDLSRRSAQLLGIEAKGTARVHVKRIHPDGRELAARTATVETETIFVQVAALADHGRAAALAETLSRFGPSSVSSSIEGFHRVRLGPFADASIAATTLAEVKAAGYSEARIVGLRPAA